MKNFMFLSIVATLFIGCTKENSEIDTEIPVNSTEINLAIGVKENANLNDVFKTLNNLHFDIRQMNGFIYNSNTPANGIANLIDVLNQKSYINTGAWKATPYTVYYFQEENKTRIINSLFNMNLANQTDFLNLISSLKLEDRLSETKDIYLSIPVGTQTYWKTQMMKYSFVKWTETFDQTCISYEQAYIISANIPSNGNVNQTIPITITFGIYNGCGGFDNITETNSGNTKTISLKAKYEGCYCTQVAGKITTTYNFTPTTTGLHTIKFLQPNGEFLTYSITIK